MTDTCEITFACCFAVAYTAFASVDNPCFDLYSSLNMFCLYARIRPVMCYILFIQMHTLFILSCFKVLESIDSGYLLGVLHFYIDWFLHLVKQQKKKATSHNNHKAQGSCCCRVK